MTDKPKFTVTELRDPDYTPKGEQECLCRACNRVFTGLAGFVRHRKGGVCSAPTGYTLDHRGRWTKGGGKKRTPNFLKAGSNG